MIPTSPAECSDDTVGGLPALECEGIDPETYQVTLNGGWNAVEGLPPELYPVLIVGAQSPGDFDPAPPGTGTFVAAVAYAPVLEPIVGTPTFNDVPGDFVVMYDGSGAGPQPSAGMFMPLANALAVIPVDTPFWLRYEFTDENGCVTTAYIYFDQGLPADDLSAVHLFLLIQGQVHEVTVPATAVTGEPGPPMDELVLEGITPVCPAPQKGVAVIPACGAMPVEGVEGGTPVPVTIQEGGGPTVMAVTAQGTTDVAPGANASVAIPAGTRLIAFNHDASTPAAELNTYIAVNGGVQGVVLFPGEGPMILEAPAGTAFPGIDLNFNVDAGAGGNRYMNWTAFG